MLKNNQFIQTQTKRITCIAVLLLAVLLLQSCSSHSSIEGTWRLISGEFSFIYDAYDACALEFTGNGEYILHEGNNYDEIHYRGNYSFDGKQLNMVVDDVLILHASASLNDNRLTLVTSSGPAVFEKVNMQSPASEFDHSIISTSYRHQGYNTGTVTLIESSAHKQVFQTRLTRQYRYMDTEILQEDQYVYSPISQEWYLSHSEVITSHETWHVNGLWKCGNETLRILSFGPAGAVIEYHWSGNPVYDYSGSIMVEQVNGLHNKEYLRITLPGRYGSGYFTTIRFHSDEGLLSTTGRPFTFCGN